MVQMTEQAMLPACAKDLERFKGMEKLAGNRKAIYEAIVEQLEKLKVPLKWLSIGVLKGLGVDVGP